MDDRTDEQLDQSYAAIARAARERQRSSIVEMSLVAGAAILIAVSTAFSAWNTWELRKLTQEGVETRKIILLGTECVVEQLSEHRHLNGLAHRAAAKDHGYTYPIAPDNEPPVVPGVLENVCKAFLHTTTSTNPARR